ncbi:MAG: hypothetical protein HY720_21585 [Planctomycetes bacterium]|nr:hypothetical protein [Planctomycetota bacterium]
MKDPTRVIRASSRGSALIVTVAVLAVLLIVAVGFARLMVVERDASRAHSDHVRARFLAESGVEAGMAELAALVAQKPYLTDEDPFFFPPGRGVQLEVAPQVSYQAGVTLGYPYSGTIDPPPAEASRYAPQGSHYALKIMDATGLVYVGQMESGGNGNTRILNNLGRFLSAGGSFAVLDGFLGTALANREPAGGYRHRGDLERALAAEYGASADLARDFVLLSDYITFAGWKDPHTVRPGAGVLAMVPDANDRVAAQPINVNTAPRDLLRALFAGIQATWTDGQGNVVVNTVSDDKATFLADEILEERQDHMVAEKDEGDKDPYFYSQADFESFLVRHVQKDYDAVAANELGRRDVQTMLAMANPNGKLTRFNPDLRLRYLWGEWKKGKKGKKHIFTKEDDRNDHWRIYADKSRLTQWTTEICFDERGRFRIVSLGRLVAADGSIIAQHEIDVVVRVAEPMDWTTQSELENLLAAGARSYVRTYPESVPANGAPHDPSGVEGGLYLAPSDGLPGAALLASARTGDAAAYLPAGHSESPNPPWNPLNTGPVMSGTGDRHADGYIADPSRQRVQAFSGQYMPVAEGTGEFWVKMSEQGLRQSGGLFWATNDMPERTPTGIPNHDEGINTIVYYQWDPGARKGYIHISRTYFFFEGGVPSTGTTGALKWELTGRLKSNAFDILKEEGRRVIQPSLDQMTGWDDATKARWREVFAQWFAERVMSAFTGGEFNSKIVGIGHAVIEDIDPSLPVMCARWSSENLERLFPLILEGEISAKQREWATAAFHDVVNETDKLQYSFQNFAVNPGDYGAYYMETVIDPVDGQSKKRWQALKNLYAKILARGLELPYAASRIEIVKEVYKEELKNGLWVPKGGNTWKPGEWHHVQLAWWDTTGYLSAWLDGKDDYDTLDEWGPMNVWSSRMRDLRSRVYFGSYILDRASDDSGNTGSPSRDLYWYTSATTDRLVVRNDRLGAGRPTQDRYYAESPINPNAGLVGSYARLPLDLRSRFGNLLDKGTGAWIDWTEYVPASKDGDPYVDLRLFSRIGGSWTQLFRRGDEITNDQRQLLLTTFAQNRPNTLDVLALFESTGEKRENKSDALDCTPFLDSLSVKLLTGPEILYWSETQ